MQTKVENVLFEFIRISLDDLRTLNEIKTYMKKRGCNEEEILDAIETLTTEGSIKAVAIHPMRYSATGEKRTMSKTFEIRGQKFAYATTLNEAAKRFGKIGGKAETRNGKMFFSHPELEGQRVYSQAKKEIGKDLIGWMRGLDRTVEEKHTKAKIEKIKEGTATESIGLMLARTEGVVTREGLLAALDLNERQISGAIGQLTRSGLADHVGTGRWQATDALIQALPNLAAKILHAVIPEDEEEEIEMEPVSKVVPKELRGTGATEVEPADKQVNLNVVIETAERSPDSIMGKLLEISNLRAENQIARDDILDIYSDIQNREDRITKLMQEVHNGMGEMSAIFDDPDIMQAVGLLLDTMRSKK